MRKRGTKRILAWVAVLVILLGNVQGIAAADTGAEPKSAAIVEITQADLEVNEYETYYYSTDRTYTYQGDAVDFISETQIQAGDAVYDLKNRAVNISVQQAEEGTVTITLDGIQTPIGSVSGAWNSTYAGIIQTVYQTNIPGVTEVRSAEGDRLQNTITLTNVPEGTWTLSGGTIYEKANEWSPGIDFGDGNGVVKEGYFGVLPDITFTVTGSVPNPEPNPEPSPEPEPEPNPEPENRVGRLADLQITGGTLSPEFASGTIYYTLNVPQGTTTVSVNPTAETEDTIVLIRDGNGDVYAPNSLIPVTDGSKIRISAGLDIATSYFITVKTEKETEHLKDLQVTGGTLGPAFTEENSDYTLYVPENTENISLLPVTFSDKTEVKITYQKQNYSSGAPIPVKDGETIRVTGTIHSSTGEMRSKSYLLTVQVMKEAEYGFEFSADGEILSMSWDGVHEDGKPVLKVEVPKGTERLQIKRSVECLVREQGESGKILITSGIGEAVLLTEPYFGKDHYFIVEAENKQQYYIYLEEIEIEIDETLPKMDITEEDLNANKYETYYYSDQINYYYQGKYVVFTDSEHFKAGTETYSLKNQKTEVTTVMNEEGKMTISLTNLTVPVQSISGAWNSDFGGKVQIIYQTDIPGMEEIRSEDLVKPIVLDQIADGTYHLTKGTIYEKANEWSPGYDFGDGKGKVTEGYFGTLPDIVLKVDNPIEKPEGYLGEATKAKVYEDFENDLWLQYQQKELQVGETVDLYPRRVPQIISDSINNDVHRPMFHFELIQGDSISLSTESSTQKTVVKAEKAGTSIVKVSYEALDYQKQHFGGSSIVNTAYAVFTVGEKGKAVIRTNTEFQNWRHYDTIYYHTGVTVPYSFTVNAENAENLKVTVNGIEIKGNGNQYTAELENRSNVIGIVATDADGNTKSMYRVIDARFIEVNVENKTQEGKELSAGDTAKISFRGITMPVYKLATIYNPQFGKDVTRVLYENEKLGTFEGKCSQWDLAKNNDFEVQFTEAGTYLFTSPKGILCSWWGDEVGSEMTKQGEGNPNLSAVSRKDYFSVLPDFSVTVAEAGTVPDPKPDPQPNPTPNPGENGEGQKPPVLKPNGGSNGSGSGSGTRLPVKAPVQTEKKEVEQQSSNMIKLEAQNHKVWKNDLENIKGKDKNLVITDQLADGTTYTMTIYGKDVKEAADFNTAIQKTSKYEKEIQMLAPEPDIFVLEQEGEYPGEVLVQIETKKADGMYLLFRYDEETQKAVYVQKVTVKDGKTKFVVSRGGDYFIAEKAKTKSVAELKQANAETKAETAEMTVSNMPEETAENGMDGVSLLIGVLIGAGLVALIGGGYLLIRRKQKRG